MRSIFPTLNEHFHELLASKLTEWYRANCRDLPWRKDRSPYGVLVSEAMLQQTQVERVKGFYVRWMERFPTLASLAEASEEEVIGLWQGLGYYSRARNLLKTAQTLKSMGLDGLSPDRELLSRLPGLGPYTTGALCSIAFDLPVPAVDGNVRRVFSRLLDLADDPAKKKGADIVEAQVLQTLRLGRPHILTQAFMELGATHCAPAFHCESCPVSDLCAAFAAGTQGQRPVSEARSKVKRRWGAALLAGGEKDGWTLRLRPAGGLWAGFYEIPWLVGEPDESAESCFERLRAGLGAMAPCRASGLEETLKFTQWQVRVKLWRGETPLPDAAGTCRRSAEDLKKLPMPAGLKRLALKALNGEKEQLPLFTERDT